MLPLVQSSHGARLRVTPTRALGAAAKRGVFTALQIVRTDKRLSYPVSFMPFRIKFPSDGRSVPPHTVGALSSYSAAHGGVLP
jgi:hypothetical protein